jgi:hypothetical protein
VELAPCELVVLEPERWLLVLLPLWLGVVALVEPEAP